MLLRINPAPAATATICQLLCHSLLGWSAGVPPCPLQRATWISPSSVSISAELKGKPGNKRKPGSTQRNVIVPEKPPWHGWKPVSQQPTGTELLLVHSPMEKTGKKVSVLHDSRLPPTVREVEIDTIKSSFLWWKVVCHLGAVHRKHNFSSFKSKCKARLWCSPLQNILKKGSNSSSLVHFKRIRPAAARHLLTHMHQENLKT